MKHRLRIPIRLKFMLTFVVLVTLVVGMIVYSTSTQFREDKLTYVNGLTSMVAVGTAEEARSALLGYQQQLELYSRFLVEQTAVEPEALSRTLFEQFPDLVALMLRDGTGEPAGIYNLGLLESSGLNPERVVESISAISTPGTSDLSLRKSVRNLPLSDEMPTFALVFEMPRHQERPLVVAALLRSERLQHIVSRFSAYEQFLIDSAGNFVAHSDPSQIAEIVSAKLSEEITQGQSEFSAGVTLEYAEQGFDWIGSFAGVDVGEVIAGARIPASSANLASRRIITRTLSIAALLLAVSLVASVFWAHRLTRPMERLSAATRRIAAGDFDVSLKIDSADEMGELASSFNHMAVELTERDAALDETQQQLVQSEKMSAFGQLGAGIAHEVKNPLAGILACAELACDDVDQGSSVHTDLKLIEKEARRCKEIIENLLRFARQEKTELTEIELNHVVEDSIAIVNHQLAINSVGIHCDLQDVPPVLGNANQLQQVFINLLINAQQAMEDGGEIHVSSRLEDDGVIRLRFADDGPGIPEELRAKIFEPLFTTKPVGKGTGLGLSVSYGIVKDHRGDIEIESQDGAGTTFVISLAPADSAEAGTGVTDPGVVVIPEGVHGNGASVRT